jgi:hypothetical protein
MAEELRFYPYNWHWIRVSYILDNGNFIEDTAYFCVKAGVDSCIERQLFEGKTRNKVMCECIKEGEKVILRVYLQGHLNWNCRYYWYDRIGSNHNTTYKPIFLTIENDDECIVAEFKFQPYYHPFKRPLNSGLAAGIFGIATIMGTVCTLGLSTPALLAANVAAGAAYVTSECNQLSYKGEKQYTEFYTPVSKQTLLNKLKNEDINSVRRQYPRLFSK